MKEATENRIKIVYVKEFLYEYKQFHKGYFPSTEASYFFGDVRVEFLTGSLLSKNPFRLHLHKKWWITAMLGMSSFQRHNSKSQAGSLTMG